MYLISTFSQISSESKYVVGSLRFDPGTLVSLEKSIKRVPSFLSGFVKWPFISYSRDFSFLFSIKKIVTSWERFFLQRCLSEVMMTLKDDLSIVKGFS